MPHTLTVYDRSKKYKADLHAFHDYAIVYASIGCSVTVSKLATVRSIWGTETTDWTPVEATIFITNTYYGSLSAPAVPSGAPSTPPSSGGGPSLTKSGQYRGTNATLQEAAYGFLSITIKGSDVTSGPGSAALDIGSVASKVAVSVDDRRMEGDVSASSILSENSIW